MLLLFPQPEADSGLSSPDPAGENNLQQSLSHLWELVCHYVVELWWLLMEINYVFSLTAMMVGSNGTVVIAIAVFMPISIVQYSTCVVVIASVLYVCHEALYNIVTVKGKESDFFPLAYLTF